jgi:hypothetical protein
MCSSAQEIQATLKQVWEIKGGQLFPKVNSILRAVKITFIPLAVTVDAIQPIKPK